MTSEEALDPGGVDGTKSGTDGTVRPPVALRPADRADLPDVLSLLEDSDLPTAGVEEFLSNFVVVVSDSEVIGVAGLEIHGRDGVLRSVAVDPAFRGEGLGGRLTERALDLAREIGLARVYLLTTTAEEYFPRHGFRRIDRSEASRGVRESVEFREACPASAVAMAYELEPRRA